MAATIGLSALGSPLPFHDRGKAVCLWFFATCAFILNLAETIAHFGETIQRIPLEISVIFRKTQTNVTGLCKPVEMRHDRRSFEFSKACTRGLTFENNAYLV